MVTCSKPTRHRGKEEAASRPIWPKHEKYGLKYFVVRLKYFSRRLFLN